MAHSSPVGWGFFEACLVRGEPEDQKVCVITTAAYTTQDFQGLSALEDGIRQH